MNYIPGLEILTFFFLYIRAVMTSLFASHEIIY